MKKLHLGCGRKKREGWINIDADKGVKPDVVANVKSLKMFENNSVDVIECCHLLEHLTYKDAFMALKEWHRILKKGGTLLIELPNLQRCVEMIYNKEPGEAFKYALIGIYGGGYLPDKSRPDSIHQLHKSGWTLDYLKDSLLSMGFSKVNSIPITQEWRKASQYNRDMRLECTK